MRRQTACLAAVAIVALLAIRGATSLESKLAAAQPVKTLEGFVVSILSGDQFKMVNSRDSKQYIVRLDGVDAPEKGQPFCDEAREALSEKIAARRVTVDCTSGERIKGYIGRVKCDDVLINKVMIEEGWAWYSEKMLPKPSETLAKLHTEAKDDKRGLWALKDPIAPWEFAANQPVAVARRLGRKRGAKDSINLAGGAGESALEGAEGDALAPKKRNGKDKEIPEDAIASYVVLMKAWQADVQAWGKKVQGWNGKKDLLEKLKKADFGPKYAKQFFEFSDKYPKTELSMHALWMTINSGNLGDTDWDLMKQAKERLVTDFKDHDELPLYLFNLLNVYPDELVLLAQGVMREVLDTSSVKDNQGCACYALAISLWEEEMPTSGEEEVLGLLTRVETEYKAVDLGVFKLGDVASENIYFIKNLTIGKVPPDIVGKGMDGKQIKLSDYRGKVVVIDFWGDWCPVCRQMYPHNRDLAEKHASEPFALLGVNSDKDKRRLKEAADREGITWPNWLDGSGGKIAEDYMVEAFPTVYVLDAEGKIQARFRGNPGDTLDKVVEKLLADLASGKSSSEPAEGEKPEGEEAATPVADAGATEKPTEEPAKTEETAKTEPAKTEPAKTESSDSEQGGGAASAEDLVVPDEAGAR